MTSSRRTVDEAAIVVRRRGQVTPPYNQRPAIFRHRQSFSYPFLLHRADRGDRPYKQVRCPHGTNGFSHPAFPTLL